MVNILKEQFESKSQLNEILLNTRPAVVNILKEQFESKSQLGKVNEVTTIGCGKYLKRTI